MMRGGRRWMAGRCIKSKYFFFCHIGAGTSGVLETGVRRGY
jgi:hypothetical protein